MNFRIGDLVVPNIDILNQKYGSQFAKMILKVTETHKLPWKITQTITESELNRVLYQIKVLPGSRFDKETYFSFTEDELNAYNIPQEKLE